MYVCMYICMYIIESYQNILSITQNKNEKEYFSK